MARRTKERGGSLPGMARRLQMSPRTLRDWAGGKPRLAVPLGRPVHRSPRPLRTEVLALLAELGPATGVATLKECFPEMLRSELADMLERYRRVLKKRYPERTVTLHWTGPGMVWAIDHTETPPIDGREELVLAARDLASGQQLLAWPSESTTAQEARTALALLFAREGVPLVLKMDNGSPFVAGEMNDFLAERGVFGLYSPPGTPQYNGAIEAGIGSLKSRVERRVAAKGTPEAWGRDELEAARLEANALARPRGPNGPTPDELWAARPHVTVEDRARFREAVERQRRLAMEGEGLTEMPASKSEARRIDRVALRRALVEHGFLFIHGKANSSKH